MKARSSLGRAVAWAATALLLGTLATCLAHGAMDECYSATCRLRAASGEGGTGVVFEVSRGQVFVLTNAHVARTASMNCQFWIDGHESIPLAGQTIIRHEGIDAAVVVVPVEAFAGRVPQAVPIAPRGTAMQPGDAILSAGCAGGAWPTGWRGHVLGFEGPNLRFTPAPLNGRSGSAIFDADGQYIVGLIYARVEDSSGTGLAVTLENLYRALNFEQTATGIRHAPEPLLVAVPAQYRPGQCPDGKCGPEGFPAPGGRLLPYRGEQDRNNQQQDGRLGRLESQVWPTLPPQRDTAPPQIDVAPIIDIMPPPLSSAPEIAAPSKGGWSTGGILGVVIGLALAVGLRYLVLERED